MRVNLVTPFAEKDAVKALGARWDAAKKVWYVSDMADLTPFARWIPDRQALVHSGNGNFVAATESDTLTARTRRAIRPASHPTPAQSAARVPHCGCSVLPWFACKHSLSKR